MNKFFILTLTVAIFSSVAYCKRTICKPDVLKTCTEFCAAVTTEYSSFECKKFLIDDIECAAVLKTATKNTRYKCPEGKAREGCKIMKKEVPSLNCSCKDGKLDKCIASDITPVKTG